MQQQDFDRVPKELLDKLAEEMPEAFKAKPEVEKAITDHFHGLKADGKIFSLAEDECALLLAYRAWKDSPSGVGGLFWWRKP